MTHDVLAAIAARFEVEIDAAETLVLQLIARRAGLVRDPTGDDARRRLHNPRLKTTYPRERITALNKQILDYREIIAKGLPPIVEAMAKLDMAEAELTRTERLMQETAAELEHYRVHHIYPETLAAIGRLYMDFGISRHHFATASDDQMKAIATILSRHPGAGDPA
jgi:hypothetical protein